MIRNTLPIKLGNPESLKNQPKTRIKFLGSWWSENKKCFYIFCLRLVALYFGGMRNSIDFCKGIFLHLIAVTL